MWYVQFFIIYQQYLSLIGTLFLLLWLFFWIIYLYLFLNLHFFLYILEYFGSLS